MKKAVLSFCLILAFNAAAKAQEYDSLRYEVGFDTGFLLNALFGGGASSAPGLFLKMNRLDKKWWRMGLNFSIDKTEEVTELGYYRSTAKERYFISPFVGIEKRVSLGRKWNVLYGSMAFYSYERVKGNSVITDPDRLDWGHKIDVTDNWGHTIGIRPFFGITFSITPKLYVSAESYLQASWREYFEGGQRAVVVTNQTTGRQGWGQQTHYIRRSDYRVFFFSASSIHFFYRF